MWISRYLLYGCVPLGPSMSLFVASGVPMCQMAAGLFKLGINDIWLSRHARNTVLRRTSNYLYDFQK